MLKITNEHIGKQVYYFEEEDHYDIEDRELLDFCSIVTIEKFSIEEFKRLYRNLPDEFYKNQLTLFGGDYTAYLPSFNGKRHREVRRFESCIAHLTQDREVRSSR